MEDLKNLFNEWVEVQKWVITILTLLPPPSKIEMKFLFWQLCVLFTNSCSWVCSAPMQCFQAPPTNMFVNEAKHFSLCSVHNSYWGRKRSISSWPRVYLHNCRAHRGTTPPVRSLVSIRNYDASFEKFRNLPTWTNHLHALFLDIDWISTSQWCKIDKPEKETQIKSTKTKFIPWQIILPLRKNG